MGQPVAEGFGEISVGLGDVVVDFGVTSQQLRRAACEMGDHGD